MTNKIESENRVYSLLPIRNPKLWEHYKNHIASFWTVEEIDLTQDSKDFETKLNDNERHFIKHILAFFAQSDGIVNENLAYRFYREIKIPEARAFYSIQSAIETIHAETYGLLLETLVKDEDERNKLFNAMDNFPAIDKKASWAIKHMNSKQPLAERLLAFAIVEGIFFSGAFCSIYWLKKRGLMPGLAQSNEFISRDEGLHWTFAADLYDHLNLTMNKDLFKSMVMEAVEMEKEFIVSALPVSLIGMNSTLMSQYIEFIADDFCVKFKSEKIYGSENPFSFVIFQNLDRKTNFFEKRVSEYQNKNGTKLGFDEDF